MPTISNPPARTRGWRLALGLLALAVAPALLWFASERLLTAHGPAWGAANFDPSYQYLLSSLLVAEGVSPGHTDHPGTPVQAFGAASLLLLHPTASAEERAQAVLADPETHLRTVVRLATALAGLVWFAAGWVFWRTGGSFLVALACQALPLAFGQTYFALALFTPELLFLTLAGWLGIVVATATLRTPDWGWRLIVSTGLFIGTAVMTKVNWIPLAAVLVLVPLSWKARTWTAVAATATIGAWLLFILPAIAHTFRWLTQIATHAGRYGGGPAGLPGWTAFQTSLSSLWHSEPMHVGLVVAASLGLLLPPLLRRERPSLVPVGSRALFLLLLGSLGVLLIAAKHPAHHYILPIAAASPAIAFLSLTGLAAIPAATGRRLANGGALALLLGTAVLAPKGLREWETLFGNARKAGDEVEHLVRLHPADRIVHYYRGSSLPYALQFGNGYAHRRYSEYLRRTYPDVVFFNVFNAKFEDFGGGIEPVDFYASSGSVLFVGSCDLDQMPYGLSLPRPSHWLMQRLDAPAGMFLFRLAPTPDP